ncbi:hypothetical protein DL96DRAFT_1687785 [Flagelloscypha sp. PMI_526]|nr:hypothetical protein DL96DRAFT_1687785 [Flagelloscypha sp. PMI_526]
MHIRDEHLRKDTRGRLQQRFEANRKDTASAPRKSSEIQPLNETDEERNSDFSNQYSQTEPPTTNSLPQKTSFRAFIEQCQALAQEDDEDEDYEEMELHVPLEHSEEFQPVPLGDLFDFSNEMWSKKFENSRGLSLDEEMELYELLDFDADREPVDDAVDIDDTTNTILLE